MAYRRTERVEARLAENRRRIVDAARRLMAEGGFRQAQVSAVAQMAGVATGTVYRYFPSKTDLFTAVFRQVAEREVAVLRAIAEEREEGPRARLAAAVRTFARRALRAPRLAWALIAEPLDAEFEAERLRFRTAYAAVFADILRQGIAAGDLPEQDAALSAAAIVGAVAEALTGPLAACHDDEEAASAPLIDHVVTFCLGAVTVRGDLHDPA